MNHVQWMTVTNKALPSRTQSYGSNDFNNHQDNHIYRMVMEMEPAKFLKEQEH